jgi:hypothetical protein
VFVCCWILEEIRQPSFAKIIVDEKRIIVLLPLAQQPVNYVHKIQAKMAVTVILDRVLNIQFLLSTIGAFHIGLVYVFL